MAKLKGNVLIRTGTFPDRHCKADCLKVEEISGQGVSGEICRRSRGIEVSTCIERVCFYAQLRFVEEFVRHITQVSNFLVF